MSVIKELQEIAATKGINPISDCWTAGLSQEEYDELVEENIVDKGAFVFFDRRVGMVEIKIEENGE